MNSKKITTIAIAFFMVLVLCQLGYLYRSHTIESHTLINTASTTHQQQVSNYQLQYQTYLDKSVEQLGNSYLT